MLLRCLPTVMTTLALALTACASEAAQLDPTQVKLNDVDERLGRVERVVNNQSLVELSQRIDVLEAQLRELRGSVEELQNSNELLRKQQRDLYADLDRRLSALDVAAKGGAGAAANTIGGGAGAGAGPNAPVGTGGTLGAGFQGGNDQADYARAFDALKAAKYDAAISQFHEFLRAYPQSSLAGNAQYWLGEAYDVTRDYDSAAAAFRAVGEQHPQSGKVADAMLKLGLTQYEQKRLAEARATLNQVVQRYPGSESAKLAADRLTKMPPDAP